MERRCDICRIEKKDTVQRSELITPILCDKCLQQMTIGELKKLSGEFFEQVLTEICRYI